MPNFLNITQQNAAQNIYLGKRSPSATTGSGAVI